MIARAALIGSLSLVLTLTFPHSGAGSQQAETVLHHAVTTSSAAAQAAFDKGLLDYYAYNVEAAEHEFYAAADFDPHLAMAWWGIAQANASDLNIDPTDDRDQQGEEAITKAQELEQYASPEERAYIEAAAQRFSSEPKAKHDQLLVHYRDAMAQVYQSYPNDADAAALYGEAQLYVFASGAENGKGSFTDEERRAYAARMATLLPFFQAALRRYPLHPGVLHFYIHAADEARQQAVAVGAAKTLASLQFEPTAAHLTHMPGHIFLKMGMYGETVDTARRSVDMDYANINCCHPGYYSEPRYYHDHNVTFLMVALTETGQPEAALAAAQKDGSRYLVARQLVVLKRWDQILGLESDPKSATLVFTKGLAYAAKGDRQSLQTAINTIPVASDDDAGWKTMVAAMKSTLQAQAAMLDHDDASALRLLTQAGEQSDRGDAMMVSEYPTLYYYSPHLALAQLAQHLQQPAVARAAYEAELRCSPKSPAALQGLALLQP
ncbi:MAG: hypothetical protein JOZ91_05090 [Candidatus Eremiobacteraeota bacterium]|nr:hypothetical protein [Candidatus Eremiobacteraeota bacterium]